MVNKKRKAIKSPEHLGKAHKEPKMSDSPVSGTLVADTRSNLTYTPTSTQASTVDCTWQGGSGPLPDSFTSSSSQSAKQIAPTPSKPISTITRVDMASITSWKPKDQTNQPFPPSNSQPASQDSDSSEGISKNPEKPRNKSSTMESELGKTPLPLPFPPAFSHKVTSPEDTCLIPISPPPHVKHAHTSPPILAQTLDKKSQHQTHATEHVSDNPIPNPKSEDSSNNIPSRTLLHILQGQQALIQTTTKMETEIASLKEDNKKLWSFIHEEILSGLNQLTKIMIDKNKSINQSITSISNTHTKDFETSHKHNTVINNNIKNIIMGNQAIESKIVSIEEKLPSTTVEQKLNNLEKTIENLQPLKSDTPMDMTPMPQSTMPLPPSPLIPNPLSEPLYSSAPNVL